MQLGEEWPFDQTIIITGTGRSGTTILGKIVGSMERTIYLFEPAIAKLAFHVKNELQRRIVRRIILEDYVIPIVTGRANSNQDNREDDSHASHYWFQPKYKWDIEFTHKYTLNRKEALQELHHFILVIKTNESQKLLTNIKQILPNCKILHIIRDINSVIGSTLVKGWYSDEWIDRQMVDFSIRNENCKLPWYIPEQWRDMWPTWNLESRIAAIWVSLLKSGIQESDYSLKYKDLGNLEEIGKLINWLKSMGLKETELMYKHLYSASNHSTKNYPEYILPEAITEELRSIRF